MKKKSLFKRVSGVLTGVFFSTSFILAANENGQLFGSETLIVVVALLLLFVPLFLYVRKLHSNMNDRSDRIIKENAALESLNKEISSRNEEVNTRNEELDSRNKSLEGQIEQQEERYLFLREQNDDLAKANSDLVRKNNELELVISTLNNNKKELEQLIVTKIKENDMIQREAADKLAEAEKRLKDAESINDNFFIETIHEMRPPLSLVLGSLALVVQNDDPEKDMSTQLLSAYRNTLAMQDLADQLIGTHRSNDVANYLRIARYDMVEIARQICDIFVDWVAMNNIDFRINTQTPTLWVWMDRRKMEFALRMLLSNAFLVKLNARQKEEIAELIHVIPQKKETGKKLLVIDDSDQIRWFLKHVFNKEYQILEARNGQDGINVALKEEPDLILCDVMMPVKDGYETCREIKNDPKMAQTPVVMLTAKVESEDVITGIEAGADDYITKPFDVEILRSKINSLMKKRDDMKRYFSNSSAASHNEENTLSTNPFMDAVVKNIEKHLDDSTFEAKVLADSLNMSLPTLYRKIKQYSDLSILELTRNIRLKKAAELLASQQYSVQEVAEMVGFNDTATFRKRFTEQYGVTPSQYGIPA